MTRKDLIDEAISTLNRFDEDRLVTVNKLLHSILNVNADPLLSLNAALMAGRSGALNFLNEEPVLYTDSESLIQLK